MLNSVTILETLDMPNGYRMSERWGQSVFPVYSADGGLSTDVMFLLKRLSDEKEIEVRVPYRSSKSEIELAIASAIYKDKGKGTE